MADTTKSKGEAELERNRVFIFQELAATDPILSKIPTKDVVDSYQQLLRTTPNIANDKELTRAFLRRACASHANDPLQGQQSIEANIALLKQHKAQMETNTDRSKGKPKTLSEDL